MVAYRDPVRRLIGTLVKERRLTLSDLSKKIPRNHAYMQQFMEREIPKVLPEIVRSRLADLLGIDETLLGAQLNRLGRIEGGKQDVIEVPQFDIQAGAGSAVPIEREPKIGEWSIPTNYVRHSLSLNASNLAIIQVRGDSMEPTLRSGDLVMVDMNDRALTQPGIFALYEGDGTVVKRVEKIPGSSPALIRLLSENPRHSSYDVLAEIVNIAGRVVWTARRI